MRHLHIINGKVVHCDCPSVTQYPTAPSLVDQVVNARRQHRKLFRDLSPEQFVEYDKVVRADHQKEVAGGKSN